MVNTVKCVEKYFAKHVLFMFGKILLYKILLYEFNGIAKHVLFMFGKMLLYKILLYEFNGIHQFGSEDCMSCMRFTGKVLPMDARCMHNWDKPE